MVNKTINRKNRNKSYNCYYCGFSYIFILGSNDFFVYTIFVIVCVLLDFIIQLLFDTLYIRNILNKQAKYIRQIINQF